MAAAAGRSGLDAVRLPGLLLRAAAAAVSAARYHARAGAGGGRDRSCAAALFLGVLAEGRAHPVGGRRVRAAGRVDLRKQSRGIGAVRLRRVVPGQSLRIANRLPLADRAAGGGRGRRLGLTMGGAGVDFGSRLLGADRLDGDPALPAAAADGETADGAGGGRAHGQGGGARAHRARPARSAGPHAFGDHPEIGAGFAADRHGAGAGGGGDSRGRADFARRAAAGAPRGARVPLGRIPQRARRGAADAGIGGDPAGSVGRGSSAVAGAGRRAGPRLARECDQHRAARGGHGLPADARAAR